MLKVVIALATGLIFGAGLTISRMIDPAKVLGFLDFGGIPSGAWDPSLALVMASALAVTAPAYYWARQRGRPMLGRVLLVPERRDIDMRLAGGAALFGAGWGLAGICPGPAIAILGFGTLHILVFFVAMLVGMAAYQYAPAALSPPGARSGAGR